MISFFYFIKWFLSLFLIFFIPEQYIPILVAVIVVHQIENFFLVGKQRCCFKSLLMKGADKMESYALLVVISIALILFVKTCSTPVATENSLIHGYSQATQKAKTPEDCGPCGCLLCDPSRVIMQNNGLDELKKKMDEKEASKSFFGRKPRKKVVPIETPKEPVIKEIITKETSVQ